MLYMITARPAQTGPERQPPQPPHDSLVRGNPRCPRETGITRTCAAPRWYWHNRIHASTPLTPHHICLKYRAHACYMIMARPAQTGPGPQPPHGNHRMKAKYVETHGVREEPGRRTLATHRGVLGIIGSVHLHRLHRTTDF